MNEIWVELAYRWDEVDRFPMTSPDRVVLIPARCSVKDAGFLKMYFFDEGEAREYARNNGFRIENDYDFDFKREKALYLLEYRVNEFKKTHKGDDSLQICLSEAAAEALKDYIVDEGNNLGYKFYVSNAFDPGQIVVDVLNVELQGTYHFDEKLLSFGIKDFYTPCKEFARGFDFSKYWDEFVVPLDERFKKWVDLERVAIEEHEIIARLIPNIRDACNGKYNLSLPSEMKVVQLSTTEWVVVEDFKTEIKGVEPSQEFNVLQFHRVLTKLFKGVELSPEEAIEELKKWTFTPIKVNVF